VAKTISAKPSLFTMLLRRATGAIRCHVWRLHTRLPDPHCLEGGKLNPEDTQHFQDLMVGCVGV
jgi:hypothetical protein